MTFFVNNLNLFIKKITRAQEHAPIARLMETVAPTDTRNRRSETFRTFTEMLL